MRSLLHLFVLLTLLSLPASFCVCPANAGEVQITCYSASGTAVATYRHPRGSNGNTEWTLVDMSCYLVPPYGGTQATLDLTSMPGVGPQYGGPDGLTSALVTQAGGGTSDFTDQDFAINAGITSRTIKVLYDWIPEYIYDDATEEFIPDPNDLPPDEI